MLSQVLRLLAEAWAYLLDNYPIVVWSVIAAPFVWILAMFVVELREERKRFRAAHRVASSRGFPYPGKKKDATVQVEGFWCWKFYKTYKRTGPALAIHQRFPDGPPTLLDVPEE